MSKLDDGKSSNRRSFFPEGAFNVKVEPSNANNMIEDHDDVVVGNSSDDATPVLEVMVSKNRFPFPSKWDDAEKWLKSGDATAKSKPTPPNSAAKKKNGGFFTNNSSNKNHAFRKLQMHGSSAEDDPLEEESTKKIDVAGSLARFSFPVSLNSTRHHRLNSNGPQEESFPDSNSNLKFETRNQKPGEVFDFQQNGGEIQPKSPTSIHESVSCISGAGSICMRDMGTEMTPIASQEPSRTGTPTMRTPTLRSPGMSPSKIRPIPPPPEQNSNSSRIDDAVHVQNCPKISTVSTRAEILLLNSQLSKNNAIAAWAENGGGGAVGYSVRSEDIPPPPLTAMAQGNMPSLEEVRRSAVENRAAAWEEAELAKYTARYEREEAKIIAWENHEKAKAEAELRKMEVKVERMKAYAHERLMNKLAATRRRAEERRAAAESKKCDKLADAASRADGIRRTGSIPPPRSLLRCCLTSDSSV